MYIFNRKKQVFLICFFKLCTFPTIENYGNPGIFLRFRHNELTFFAVFRLQFLTSNPKMITVPRPSDSGPAYPEGPFLTGHALSGET